LIQKKTPSVESTYVVVRREAAPLQILKPTTSSEENTSLGEVEIGLTARNRPPEQGQGWSHPETVGRCPSQRDKEDKSHIHCTHCGMKKHTKKTCFKIVGYSEWWEDFKKKIGRLSLSWTSRKPLVTVMVTPEERKKQNRKSFMEESQSLIEVKKERRIPAQENLISGFFIVRQLTP